MLQVGRCLGESSIDLVPLKEKKFKAQYMIRIVRLKSEQKISHYNIQDRWVLPLVALPGKGKKGLSTQAQQLSNERKPKR